MDASEEQFGQVYGSMSIVDKVKLLAEWAPLLAQLEAVAGDSLAPSQGQLSKQRREQRGLASSVWPSHGDAHASSDGQRHIFELGGLLRPADVGLVERQQHL